MEYLGPDNTSVMAYPARAEDSPWPNTHQDQDKQRHHHGLSPPHPHDEQRVTSTISNSPACNESVGWQNHKSPASLLAPTVAPSPPIGDSSLSVLLALERHYAKQKDDDDDGGASSSDESWHSTNIDDDEVEFESSDDDQHDVCLMEEDEDVIEVLRLHREEPSWDNMEGSGKSTIGCGGQENEGGTAGSLDEKGTVTRVAQGQSELEERLDNVYLSTESSPVRLPNPAECRALTPPPMFNWPSTPPSARRRASHIYIDEFPTRMDSFVICRTPRKVHLSREDGYESGDALLDSATDVRVGEAKLESCLDVEDQMVFQ